MNTSSITLDFPPHRGALSLHHSGKSTACSRNILRWWHGVTERAGIGRRRFHATRHTAATLVFDAGEPLERASALLGHSSYAVTAGNYAVVTNRAMRKSVEALGAVLDG